MPVTVSIDIGTAVIPLPFTDQALAYAVSYSADQLTASVDIRQYTVSDAAKGLDPEDIYAELVRTQPGTWLSTYSSFLGLNLETKAKREFYRVNLRYDETRYCWTLVKREEFEFLMSLASGRDYEMPDSLFEAPVKTKSK